MKTFFSAGAAIGLVSSAKTTPKPTSNEKIKMLTAEGKLVEIDKSVLDKKGGAKRASNKEVFNWMSQKHKK